MRDIQKDREALKDITKIVFVEWYREALLYYIDELEKAQARMKALVQLVQGTLKGNVECCTLYQRRIKELEEVLLEAVQWLTETPVGRSIPQVDGQPGNWLSKARILLDKKAGDI